MMRLFAFLGLMLLSTLPASAANVKEIAPEVVGAWRLSFTTPDGVHRSPTVVVGRQGSELAAWYIDKDKPQAFKNVRISDDALEMTIDRREKEGQVTVKLVARANGDDRCCGQATYRFTDGDSGEWDFTGERIPPADLNHVAQWKLKFTTPEGETREPTLHVFENGDALYGWFIDGDYQLLSNSLKVDGDRATLEVSAKLPDGAMANVTFRGTIDASSVSGDVAYDIEGDRGSFAFTGKQVVN